MSIARPAPLPYN